MGIEGKVEKTLMEAIAELERQRMKIIGEEEALFLEAIALAKKLEKERDEALAACRVAAVELAQHDDDGSRLVLKKLRVLLGLEKAEA